MRRSLRGLLYVAEWWLRLPWPPGVRVWWLRGFGARIGQRVRIHRCHFINLESVGFSALTVLDDVHIGPECLFDLADRVLIEERATLAPRVMILTHADLGASRVREGRPRASGAVRIGSDVWIGAGATILHQIIAGEASVIGAGAVVTRDVAPGATVIGVPARPLDRRTIGPAGE